MKRSPILAITALLVTGHRLPAPIQEIQETPTPAATIAEAENPKQKPKTRPSVSGTAGQENVSSKGSIKPKPLPGAPFAGAWSGSLNDGRSRTILINPSQTIATVDGGPWGRETGIIEEANNAQLSWTTTPLSIHVKWTLKLLDGGKTAQVITKHFLGGESGTFAKKP